MSRATPGRRIPVPDSEDLQRILALPKRDPPGEVELEGLRFAMTAKLSRDNPACTCKAGTCITELNDFQAWALHEAPKAGGLFASAAVGIGKTGAGVLMSMVMPDCKRAVILVKPDLKPQFLRDYEAWSQHFRTPTLAGSRWLKPGSPVLHVVTYSELSNPKNVRALRQLRPDLIISDESQNLANPISARGNRFFSYLEETPECRFVAWTGTPLNDTIKNFAHHLGCALGESSPLPITGTEVTNWASHLDPDLSTTLERSPMGALKALREPDDKPMMCAREGVERRIRFTLGCISTTTPSCDVPLLLTCHPVEVPDAVKAAMKVIDGWQRPDGEEIVDIGSKARCLSEVASGFYYFHRWLGTEDRRVVDRWKLHRADFFREMRYQIALGHPHLDSKLLAERAAARWHDGYTYEGRWYPPETKWCGEDPPEDAKARHAWLDRLRTRGPLQAWDSEMFPAWREVEHTCHPEQGVKWVSDFLVEDAAAWARANVGVVWFRHRAFGSRLGKLLPLYGQGLEASVRIAQERGDRSIAASIRAHGTGKNLQMFSRALVVGCPASGLDWEQLLGRHHRRGQLATQVRFDICFHTPGLWNAFESALEKAEFAQKLLRTPQRLLLAERNFRV